jgi:hypothetical protein
LLQLGFSTCSEYGEGAIKGLEVADDDVDVDSNEVQAMKL